MTRPGRGWIESHGELGPDSLPPFTAGVDIALDLELPRVRGASEAVKASPAPSPAKGSAL